MRITQICILMFLCYVTGVLPDAIQALSRRGTDTQPFVEIGGKYYLVNTAVKMNWFAASLYCRNFDSDLTVIKSQEEMDALTFYLTNKGHIDKRFWLGLSDLADEGKFISNIDGFPMPYSKWSSGQPDNNENHENCVHLWTINNVFHMNDNRCESIAYAICELRKRSKSCEVCDLKQVLERLIQSTNAFKCQS